MAEAIEERLWRFIEERLPQVDACLLSDYGKGVVSTRLAARLIQRCTQLGLPVVVDPKGRDVEKYRGATLLKPNHEEACRLLQRDIKAREDTLEAGRLLMERLGAAVLLTRGRSGMELFQAGRDPLRLPSLAAHVIDETGAGDTVAATMTVALAAGVALEQAALLASRAAAVVVGWPGTKAVCVQDLVGPDSAWPTPDEHPDGQPGSDLDQWTAQTITVTWTATNSPSDQGSDSSTGILCPVSGTVEEMETPANGR